MEFIKQLKKRFLPQNIILVKNYLSERYGDINDNKLYDDIADIQKTNEILNEYYLFFESHYEEIKCVDAHEDKLYLMDEYFEYGRYPWHLNDWINIKIARKIGSYLK